MNDADLNRIIDDWNVTCPDTVESDDLLVLARRVADAATAAERTRILAALGPIRKLAEAEVGRTPGPWGFYCANHEYRPIQAIVADCKCIVGASIFSDVEGALTVCLVHDDEKAEFDNPPTDFRFIALAGSTDFGKLLADVEGER